MAGDKGVTGQYGWPELREGGYFFDGQGAYGSNWASDSPDRPPATQPHGCRARADVVMRELFAVPDIGLVDPRFGITPQNEVPPSS